MWFIEDVLSRPFFPAVILNRSDEDRRRISAINAWYSSDLRPKPALAFSRLIPYAKDLEAKIDINAREAIGSMVTNKLNVSHGKVSAVTLGDVENYHNRTKPIFDVLEEILGLP